MSKIKYFTFEDIPFLDSEIDRLLKAACNEFNLNINDYDKRVSIKHITTYSIMLYIYNNLFKPPYGVNLINNQSSLLTYNDDILFSFLTDKFLSICSFFGKALGVESFSAFTGIKRDILFTWAGDESNPTRYDDMQRISNYNRDTVIQNLKESNIGLIAVANNDKETGLEWGKNNAQKVEKQSVFFIPSERVDRLKLSRSDSDEV